MALAGKSCLLLGKLPALTFLCVSNKQCDFRGVGHGVVWSLPCSCVAFAIQLRGICHAVVWHLPCSCVAFATRCCGGRHSVWLSVLSISRCPPRSEAAPIKRSQKERSVCLSCSCHSDVVVWMCNRLRVFCVQLI